MVFLVSEKLQMSKINLKEKLQTFSDYWNPRIVGELNGQLVKLAKFKGEFVWHHHEHEDELFLVIEGSFEMHYREKVITLNKGEFIIVPRGVEHKPVAKEEVSVLLFEPKNTLNTGNIVNELTKNDLENIGE
jgi:mannose-6-phosphate isomerase-like protein (cupin superfamily)